MTFFIQISSLFSRSLFSWRQWFGKQNNLPTVENHKDKTVGVLQLVSSSPWNILLLICSVRLKFRFADRLDLFLMAIATITFVVETLLFVVGIVLFSRLSGTFAMESFANTCRQQQNLQQDSISPIKKNISCPLGIDLNSINFDYMHRWIDLK